MKKKALRQDFKVEIKKSINRFASILLIVALGVAFFSGIRATEPDMRISADQFYDDYNLMDIRLLSTLGLTDDDVDAIRQVNGVKEVEPSYSTDALCDTATSELVIKVMSLTNRLNKINISEGRLPENTSECLVDKKLLENTDYKIGDSIKLRAGTDEDISETLNVSEYTIVGIGTTATYLSLERGSSSIGNGKVDSYIVVPQETFNIDAYTEIFVSVMGAKELISYTDQYDEKVEAVLKKIENIADVRREARYQQILEEPNREIEKGKTELTEKEAEAKKKLEDAAIQLEDGKKELVKAQVQLDDGKEEVDKGKIEIEKNKNKLLVSEEEMKKGQQEISTAFTKLDAGKVLLQEKQQEFQAGVDSLAAGYKQWNESMSQWTSGKEVLEENENKLNSAFTELLKEKEKLEPAKDLYPEQWQTIIATEQNLLEKQGELESGKSELEKNGLELENAKNRLDTEQEKLNAGKIQLEQEGQKLAAAETTLNQKSRELQQAQKKVENGWAEIKQGEVDLQESSSLLSDKQTELNTAKETLKENEMEYQEAVQDADEKILEGKQKIADAEEEVSNIEYPKWYVLDRDSLQTYVEYGQDSERIGNIGKIFPAIFFLVAALVSLTTMTRMVEEQRTQIGTYKALGYSKKSIAGKYILYGFYASMIGSILGVIIGEKILPQVIITAYTILYDNLPKVISPINIYYGIISTLIAVLCTTLASVFACYKELMAPPAELMRPASPKLGKRVMLERIPWLWKRLNFTQKSTVRNLFRYKKRFFMTVFGIGGCMALLLVGFGLKDSISAMSEIQYVELWHQDSTITINDEVSDQEKEELYDYLGSDVRIKNSMSVKETTIDAGYGNVTKNTNLIIPEDTLRIKDYVVFRDRITQDISELQDDGVIITEKLAGLLGAKVGDTIFLKDGELSRTEVQVTGIAENYMMHYIFMSPVTYEKLYGEIPEYNKLYTINADNQKSFEEALSADLLQLDSVTNISFTSDFQNRIEDMLNNLNLVVYVLIISAGLLAFVVLYNLNNININERQRELATLKVLGFQDMEVATYVYRENIMLTIIGAIMGVFLGILLHRFVILTSEIDMMMFGRNIKGLSYLFSILLTFGFSFFVNYVMYYKLRKINMVESLKSVE